MGWELRGAGLGVVGSKEWGLGVVEVNGVGAEGCRWWVSKV